MEKHGITGTISHFFLSNKPLSWLLLVVTLLFGLVSFYLTPKQYNPEITRPAFQVTIEYAGATVDGAIERVAYELVEKIDTVPGVNDVYTEVHDGATINTTVIFEVGYDATRATLDLRSQLDQHSYLARGNIKEPTILEINPETIPVLQVVFGSDTLSVPEMRAQVVSLAHKLGSIENVSEVQVYGGYEETLVVALDPARMSASGVSVAEVSRTLAGSQARSVIPSIVTDAQYLDVVYDGVADDPATIGALSVRDGVLVRDVADVYLGATPNRSFVFYGNREGARGEVVMLSVAKVEGSSAPVVTKAVRDALVSYTTDPAYQNLSFVVVGDDGVTAASEIYGLSKNLITSIIIVSVVLFLFLSMRAAAVVLVAIPVTLLIVFGLGFLFGQTINRITLFALILSLGLLVDSAIVAVENIYAHLSGTPRREAEKRERLVARAIDEIGIGLLLSMVTSVIVFLPMNFITGMMGPYMGPIAFFVPAALIVSFLVAIVLTPFIASHVLRAHETENVLSRFFGGLMDRVMVAYVKLLRTLLYRPALQKLVLRGALLLFVVSLVLPLSGIVHFQMLPRADRDQFYVYIDLPEDTARTVTKQVTEQVSDVLLGHEEVTTVQEFVATPPIIDFNGMFKGAQNRRGAYQATIRVNLTPTTERKVSSTDIASVLRGTIGGQLPTVAPAVRFMEEPPGPPVRATMVAKLTAADQSTERSAATAFAVTAATVPGMVDLYESTDAPVGRVVYELNHAAAAALGVDPTSVAQAIALIAGNYPVTEFLGTESVEYTPLTLSIPHDYASAPNAIDQITVPTSDGEVVPLRAVVTLHQELRPSAVNLEDAHTVTYVTGEVEGRSIVYATIDLMRALLRGEMEGYEVTNWNLWSMTLQDIHGATVNLTWGGEWEMTLENFRDLGIAMGVALFMVYALLVAQYQRFATPAYILITVPLGLIGILWGFLVLDYGFNTYLTATALIGFIALIGLVVNNAIIFLEYVEQARERGLPFREALLAAGEARLLPIFLTSLTTVLGSLTIASDPVWSGLAWAIVFGLSLSTVLTLIMYPLLLVRFANPDEINN